MTARLLFVALAAGAWLSLPSQVVAWPVQDDPPKQEQAVKPKAAESPKDQPKPPEQPKSDDAPKDDAKASDGPKAESPKDDPKPSEKPEDQPQPAGEPKDEPKAPDEPKPEEPKEMPETAPRPAEGTPPAQPGPGKEDPTVEAPKDKDKPPQGSPAAATAEGSAEQGVMPDESEEAGEETPEGEPGGETAEEKGSEEKDSDGKKAEAKKEKPQPEVVPTWIDALQWRSIGPTAMGGRIVDMAVVEGDPTTFFLATASGGLFKTTNNGVTFDALFQQQDTISIGAVAVARSNPEIVWVGTGEHNPRNSVSWGDGVYKSTDGGKTFANMGLKESFQTGRIVIHPENPDVVYVGAMGRLWGSSEQRGIYKTTDGGANWERVHFIDAETGCIELKMHPSDPETLIAAMYQRKRDAFDGGDPEVKHGWGTGLFKTTDGGKNWRRITQGLPDVKLGRIGIDYCRSQPDILYATVETEKIGTAPEGSRQPALMGIMGNPGGDQPGGAPLTRVTEGGPANRAGLQEGDVVTEMAGEKIASYGDLIKTIQKKSAGEKVSLKYMRGNKEEATELTFAPRGDRGTRPFGTRLGGQNPNVQDDQGENGAVTGGTFKSTDGGESWARVNSLNPRPFYFSQVRVDPSDPDTVFVLGISLYKSTDGGKTFDSGAGSRTHADHHAMWIDPADGRHVLLGCDGGLNITYDGSKTWVFVDSLPIGQFYHVGVDTKAPYNVYGGLQDNGSWGGPSATRSGGGPTVDDWFVIGGGDGFICLADPENPDIVYYESQYGNMGRVDLATGARYRMRATLPDKKERVRFNWKTPFLLSSHNSRIVYAAGNRVFKSLDRGEDMRVVSPDLTTAEQATGTAITESPRDPDVLYAGTDDGHLWVTKDGGEQWTEVTPENLKGKARVQSLEASRYADGRCYVAFDGHYFDDDKPHALVTEDYGKTWKTLDEGLPENGSTRVLREDVSNGNLLYLGTEFGLFATLDRGRNWLRLNTNLPHVAVHEIAVHPTAGEIVAATHGRSLWILDVTPLRQTGAKTLAKDAHLYQPTPATLWQGATGRSRYGHRQFTGANPAGGANLFLALGDAVFEGDKKEGAGQLVITDVKGDTLYKNDVKLKAGLNRVTWNLRTQVRRGGRTFGGSRVAAGTYLATIKVAGKELKQPLEVRRDPEFTADTITFDEEEAARKAAKRLDD